MDTCMLSTVWEKEKKKEGLDFIITLDKRKPYIFVAKIRSH